MSTDIASAYLNAPCQEKVFTVCSLEFGAKHVGKQAIITKALYGLKTSTFAWHEHLGQMLHKSLNYCPCRADNDIWLRKATKPDGVEYYKMIFVYTDDILVVSPKPKESLTMLDHHYLLKPDSIGIPCTYLGSQVGTIFKMTIHNSVGTLGPKRMSKQQYIMSNRGPRKEEKSIRLKQLVSSHHNIDQNSMCQDIAMMRIQSTINNKSESYIGL